MGNREDVLSNLTTLLRLSDNVESARRKQVPFVSQRLKSNVTRSSPGPIDTGLFTPPDSQRQEEADARRMLISPPPEEFLRKNRAVSLRSRSASLSTQHLPATPSLVVNPPSKPAKSTAKRKRPAAATALHIVQTAQGTISHGERMSSSRDEALEATPNSKPHKQSKRQVSFVPRDMTPARPSTSNPSPFIDAGTPSRSVPGGSTSPTKCTLLVSPHCTNPNADYIPPSPSLRRDHLSASARRRSVTPALPYEPPPERFTPPREVVVHSPQKESPTKRRRSVHSAKAAQKLVLAVKKEPPVIDLTLPLPPPSPTDDPLLLSGPPRRARPRCSVSGKRNGRGTPLRPGDTGSPSLDTAARSRGASACSRDTPLLGSSSPMHGDDTADHRLPQLLAEDSMLDSPSSWDGYPRLPEAAGPNQPMVPASSDAFFEDEEHGERSRSPPRAFDLFGNTFDTAGGATSDDSWSDDSQDRGGDEDFDWSGDYTGKFRMVMVPTKADPPSSATRGRMEAWGRPRSPFPRLGRVVEGGEKEILQEEEGGMEQQVGLKAMKGMEGRPRSTEGLKTEQVVTYQPEDQGETKDADRRVAETGERVGEDELQGLVDIEFPLHDDSASDGGEVEECAAFLNEPDSTTVLSSTSRHRSPSLAGLTAGPTTQSDNGDVIMDDTSDQDTLTEPELNPVDASATRAGEKEVEVVSLGMPAGATMEVPTEPYTAEPVDHSITVPTAIEIVMPDGQETFAGEEEDSLDEAIIDRELSILPDDEDDESDDEDKEPQNVLEDLELKFLRSTHARPSPVPAQNSGQAVVAEDSPDGYDEDEVLDECIIQITSDDPLAAARAAAILRMHDYDCVPRKLAMKRRHSGIDSAMRDARRRSSLSSGIKKAFSSTPQRRHTLGGMVGDKVIMPGSPAMTLPQLLKEVENSLDLGSEGGSLRKLAMQRNAFATPSKSMELSTWAASDVSPLVSKEAAHECSVWSKKDWKRLDSCLTDERLVVGGGHGLADVDAIDLDKVVDRFLASPDGLALSHVLNRDDILRRGRTLQKKQRSGRVAPPTPNMRSLRTPDTNLRDSVSPAVTEYMNLYTGACDVNSRSAHATIPASESHAHATESQPARPDPHQAHPSIATRAKGLLYSYLPLPTALRSKVGRQTDSQPGLPVPPLDAFTKARPQILTPAPKPAPRAVPPKDTVRLHSVPLPRPSRIPRPKDPPRRLVELQPLPSASANKPSRVASSGHRRSSGGGVKALIQAFEELKQVPDTHPND